MIWIPIIYILVWFGPIFIFRKTEQKKFNHGKCKDCGALLRHFDDDGQGGRGWTCDNCHSVIWVNWVNEAREINNFECY